MLRRSEEGLEGKAPPELLLNPELSRLKFDERILAFAEGPDVPLLERVRFLSMVGDRLDDFFMSRVANFKRALAGGKTERTIDGLTGTEQLKVIADRVRRLSANAYAFLEERLLPQLREQGIFIERWDSLTEEDREFVQRTYGKRIESLVRPLVANPVMPHIRNLRPALAVVGRELHTGKERFMAIELPSDLPRFLTLAGQGSRFVALEDAIAAYLPVLYPGLKDAKTHMFRVTRSAAMDLDDEPRDILRAVEISVARRPYQEVVRIECDRNMPPALTKRLLEDFCAEAKGHASLDEQDVFLVGPVLDLAALTQIAALHRPELKFTPLKRRQRVRPEHGMIDHIRRRDLMLQFPFDDFEQSVERLLSEAANDPDVVRVSITVYRTSKDSAIIDALCAARANGKEVIAVIELKASFDEHDNIAWARDLERVGIRVILSPTQLKVHAKIGLIVRREGSELQRIAYIGTGNMNASTAKVYVDFGVLTADPELTQEVASVFDLLTGDATTADFKRLIVAPFAMRRRFLELVDREIEHAKAGRPSGIRLHINGLGDRQLIGALYRASQAGVPIDMMVRDICALKPGLPGVSENIRVVSVVGRLLHHARIYHFKNGGVDDYFIGSADWRPRNFNERVEVVAQITQPDHQAELDEFLTGTLSAKRVWQLQSDGEYVRAADSESPPYGNRT
jgi:polyphosphate kinase